MKANWHKKNRYQLEIRTVQTRKNQRCLKRMGEEAVPGRKKMKRKRRELQRSLKSTEPEAMTIVTRNLQYAHEESQK